MALTTRIRARLCLGCCLIALPTSGYAQAVEAVGAKADKDGGFFIHAGPGGLLFDAGAVVKANGTTIPGGTVSIDPNTTLIVEAGYRWRNFAVAVTGGLPPLATVNGGGTLRPYGALGDIRYGPIVITAQYHFNQSGRFRPYVGAGPVYLLIFKARDGSAKNLNVDNSVGVAVQIGAEYALTRHWSLFVDAKKAHLRTTATAELGGAPLAANIRLNPAVVAGGLSFHFR